jgi:hypothetical protein
MIPTMAKKPAFLYTEEQLEYFRNQGRKGGKIGGKARSASLTPERRSEIAKTAVNAREAKRTANKRTSHQKPRTLAAIQTT